MAGMGLVSGGKMRNLEGKWLVIVTAPKSLAVVMNPLRDHKIIDGAGNGHNRIAGVDWGYFTYAPTDNGGYVLNYFDLRNPELLRGVRDTIYPNEDGSWSGQMFMDGRYVLSFDLRRA